jgi:rhodanese-related sulfurtransferase
MHAASSRAVWDLTDNWLDILTGHAAARFKWIDVRPLNEWERQPGPKWVKHIPLQDLPTRAPNEFNPDAEVIVYGSNDAETAEAEEILVRLGLQDVLAFRGGFAILEAKLFR